MKRYKTIIDGILIDVFKSKKHEPKYTAIYLYGFPGSNGSNLFIEYLVDKGFIVFQPNYPGTFDSDGKHSPLNSISFMENVSNIIQDGKFSEIKSNKTINFPPRLDLLSGSSFGCFVALRCTHYFEKINSLILFSPVLTFSTSGEHDCGFFEDGSENVDYVAKSRPFTYRLLDKREWLDLYNGKFDLVVNKGNVNKVFSVIGENDGCFSIDKYKSNYKDIINTHLNTDLIQNILVSGGKHSISTLLSKELRSEIQNIFS